LQLIVFATVIFHTVLGRYAINAQSESFVAVGYVTLLIRV